MIKKDSWTTPFDSVETIDAMKPQASEMSGTDLNEVDMESQLLPSREIQKQLQPEKATLKASPESDAEYMGYLEHANQALSAVDTIINKGYVEQLTNMSVLEPEELDENDVILFKVDLMAYAKDEYATDKFVSAISAMTFTNNTVFLLVDGYENHTDFYLGVKNNDEQYTTRSIADTFNGSVKGQFPGIKLTDLSKIPAGHEYSPQHKILREFKDASCVSSYVGIPSLRSESGYTNANYIQGIEKLVEAMHGKRYTVVILAQNQMPSSIDAMRNAYENVYSQISCLATRQLAYSTNESIAHAITRSHGNTNSINVSISNGTGETATEGHNSSHSTNTSTGESKPNIWSKGAQLAGPIMEVGAILTVTGAGAVIGAPIMGVGALLGVGGIVKGKTVTKGNSTGDAVGESVSHSHSKNQNETRGESHGETITDSEGNTSTIGSSKNFTLTLHDKRVEELLKRIDQQLERIALAESNGMWSAATYVLSYDQNISTSQTGAAIFRSIVQGEKSGIEKSAINTWQLSENNNANIRNTIASLEHPRFLYSSIEGHPILVDGTSLLSSKELAMIMGLPRKSVPGLPILDHVSFGKEVVRLNAINGKQDSINIGCIHDLGVRHPNNPVCLKRKSLTQHVFVTGSTGSGKSETIYKLIDEATTSNATFLVIEPAKGEYKNVYGNVNVFGTNPNISPLLRINPFKFPQGIHVLEHIDRLTEIFNVCWPMYAAMPAVLKKAIIKSYESCGWELYSSTNKYGEGVFPSFADLLVELEKAINDSAYSEEVKGNYIGSLVTRIESLTNGINGEIFSSNEVSDSVLFDQNTIIDLSRVGSLETKSLIMGIIVMRLNEYRVVNAKSANSDLKHITILEEAHNILPRTTASSTSEGNNVTGKSVEMIVNSIAEMRTYGEGFIIVDQSPTSVHSAAIKNTNTKIIMRLPDYDDRRIAGKSAAMSDNQIDELAKLPTGVAAVYQNDWMQPILCSIDMKSSERFNFKTKPDRNYKQSCSIPTNELLKLLLMGRLFKKDEPDIEAIESSLKNNNMPVSTKIKFFNIINEYKKSGKLDIWKDEYFVELSSIVVSILGVGSTVEKYAAQASSFDELNKMLNELLTVKFDIPQTMGLTVRQALMRNFAEKGTSQLKIYNAWLTDIKSKL